MTLGIERFVPTPGARGCVKGCPLDAEFWLNWPVNDERLGSMRYHRLRRCRVHAKSLADRYGETLPTETR